MAINPRDFLLNTDYEMDKIIYYKSGSLSVNQYDVTISHGLGFTPLIFGVCAFNSDYSDPRAIPFTSVTQQNTTSFTASANNSNIKLSYISYNGSPGQIYYRIYGFEPSDSTANVASTCNNANEFILNTDYNYCKLYKKGTAGNDTTINHNLGYIPQVLVWSDIGGWTAPIEESSLYSNGPGARITTSDLILQFSLTNASRMHYRIYYDEA